MLSENFYLTNSLIPIDNAYRNHILSQTHLGIRTIFSDNMNNTISLLYLRMFAMNNQYYNNKIKFIHSKTYINNKVSDEFRLYIKKDMIKDIILTNIKCDLFSLSRLIPLPHNQNETIKLKSNTINNVVNVNDNSFNTSYVLAHNNISEHASINKLLAFIDNNIALKLLTHQLNNISWMMQLENHINNNMVYVMCPHYKLINSDIIKL